MDLGEIWVEVGVRIKKGGEEEWKQAKPFTSHCCLKVSLGNPVHEHKSEVAVSNENLIRRAKWLARSIKQTIVKTCQILMVFSQHYKGIPFKIMEALMVLRNWRKSWLHLCVVHVTSFLQSGAAASQAQETALLRRVGGINRELKVLAMPGSPSNPKLPPFLMHSILCTVLDIRYFCQPCLELNRGKWQNFFVMDVQQRTFMANNSKRIYKDKVIESYLSVKHVE